MSHTKQKGLNESQGQRRFLKMNLSFKRIGQNDIHPIKRN